MLARFRSIARGVFGRDRMEQDMAEEFQFLACSQYPVDAAGPNV
jgi:hypothetical protein